MRYILSSFCRFFSFRKENILCTVRRHLIILFLPLCLLFSGCVAAAVPLVAVSAAGVAAGIVSVVNLARDQYPDINFDKPAPVATTYSNNYDAVWNSAIDTLMEMKESAATVDKTSGIIRTNKKGLNDVSWIGKGLGKSTFMYELNILVRHEKNGVAVTVTVPFWEEKMFISSKEKNIPEGSNMMRHIFYRNLNKRLHPAFVRMPDSPTQDIRFSPLNQEVNGNGTETKKVEKSGPVEQKTEGKENSEQGAAKVSIRIKSRYSKINVRSEPSIKSAAIAALKGGDEVEKLDENGKWIKIQFYGTSGNKIEGWVIKSAVESR